MHHRRAWHARHSMILVPKSAMNRTTAPPSNTSTSTASTPSIDLLCPSVNGTRYTTSTNQPYELYCSTDFNGGDLTTVNAISYSQCVDQCDAYVKAANQSNGAVCVGSVYMAENLNQGNCYLKYQIQLKDVWMNNAILQAARKMQYPFNGPPVYSSYSTPTGTSESPLSPTAVPSPTSSKAPSKKPALDMEARVDTGVTIAAVVLLCALFVLWRRKRQRRRLVQRASIIEPNRSLPMHDLTTMHGMIGSAVGSPEPANPPVMAFGKDVGYREHLPIYELPGFQVPQLRINSRAMDAPDITEPTMTIQAVDKTEETTRAATEAMEKQNAGNSKPTVQLPNELPKTSPKRPPNLSSGALTIPSPKSRAQEITRTVSPTANNTKWLVEMERSRLSSPKPPSVHRPIHLRRSLSR